MNKELWLLVIVREIIVSGKLQKVVVSQRFRGVTGQEIQRNFCFAPQIPRFTLSEEKEDQRW